MSTRGPNDIFRPRPDRRLRYLGIAAVFLAVAIVGSGAVVGLRQALASCPFGAYTSGVHQEGGECVGVTDGSYVFHPTLKAAEDCIRARNDWVATRHQPYVTIAFLGPLSSTANTGNTSGRVPHLLEGACTAQYRVNEAGYRGDHPLIRMVLANEGVNEGAWHDVVGQLEGMTGNPDHLVAVVGLGLSQDETVRGARQLSGDSIPMVGAVITGNGLDTSGAGLTLDGRPVGAIPGLTRVTTPVGIQLAAIASFLQQQSRLRTAVLVNDVNAPDLYTRSLTSTFRGSGLAPYLRAGGDVDQPFNGRLGNAGLGNVFTTISNNLCGFAPPDMVFYAGREVSLPILLRALGGRNCRSRPITIVTGSDAEALTLDSTVPASLAAAPISVLYTPLASPTTLGAAGNPARSQYTEFANAFTNRGFDTADLNDAWGIMAHDAVLTAAIAIRNAVGSTNVIPSPTQVGQQLYELNGPINSVPGADGTFGIDPNTGSPVGRPVPIFELSSAARDPVFTYQATPHGG